MVCGIEMIYNKLYVIAARYYEAMAYADSHNINRRNIIHVSSSAIIRGTRGIIIAYADGWERHEDIDCINNLIHHSLPCDFVDVTGFSIDDTKMPDIVPKEMFIID